MNRTSFNDGWQVRPKVNPFGEMSGQATPYRPVAVPHDAMIEQPRDPGGDPAVAYFRGGAYEYRKTFSVPRDWRGKRILLEFEGVYRDAKVYLNGDYAGGRPYGYSRFQVDADRFLRFGQDNEVRVECRSHKDSRWYSGAGLYRDTWLLVGDPVRIAADGVRVSTPDIDAERAVVEVATRVVNDSTEIHTLQVVTVVRDGAAAVVAGDTTPLTVLPGEPVVLRRRVYVREPRLWGTADPALYTAEVTLGDVDSAAVPFGIRELRLDPVHGLRINGETVKLRGACIHHDNGPLGAATFAAAEERRVRLLKQAGFNAIRMSHHPASIALLDACDRLGMLVVDEAFDMWTEGKTEFDYHLHFADWWERDLESMVVKDRNHPSVIMYSIGNEIPEAGTPSGAAWGRRLAEKVRELDSTRPITNGVNNMLAVMSDVSATLGQHEGEGINTVMANAIGDLMNTIGASDLVTRRTAESYGLLDVAGMNYSESRYALDKELFPNRIILGTETFPTRVDENWALVQGHGHVIGDFTWTGWDYLGEVGLGRPQYLAEGVQPVPAAPNLYLVADCGDLDITGHRRPASYYREIVFGLRPKPYLAVVRPEHHGKTFSGTPWAWSDAIASWTWPGYEGKPITVEVYAAADEIELLVNGQSRGRQPVRRFRAVFDVVFEPGEITAVAYRNGTEAGRDAVPTAGAVVALRAEAERPVVAATGGDLAFVALTLVDAHGTVHPEADAPVTVEVSGDGVLAALGSGDPCPDERFDADTRHTYRGRALAVLRPTGPGKIRLLATVPGLAPAEVVLTVGSGIVRDLERGTE